MTDYLLDTTIIIDYLRGKKGTVAFLKRLFSGGATFSSCAITVAEIYAGMRESEREVTEELIESFDYHELTKTIAKKAGELRRSYLKQGKSIPLPDVMIAAIALENNLTLVTDNIKHYPMTGLEVFQVLAVTND